MEKENKFVRFCDAFVCKAAAVFAAAFAGLSLVYTCYLNDVEKTVFAVDNVVLNLALFAVLLLLLTVLWHTAKTPRAQKTVMVVSLVFAAATGLFWVFATRGEPVADTYFCYAAAQSAAQDNYDFLAFGSYIYKFPYQLGFVLVLEGAFRLFGAQALTAVCTALGCVNLIFILASGAVLCRMAYDARTQLRDAMLTAVLFAAFVPFVQYAIFIYGNDMATGFLLLACCLAARCMQHFSWRCGVGAALLLSAAACLKTNTAVALVAFIILFCLAGLREKDWHQPVAALLCAALFFLPAKGVQALYEQRAGVEHLRGTPMLVYITMGLTDSDVLAPGWYNGQSYTVLEDAAYDYDVANARLQVEAIQRLAAMKNDLGGTVNFFWRKTQSVWTDPVFGINYVVYAHTQPRFAQPYLESVYEADATAPRMVWLGVLQTFIYAAAAYGLWRSRRGAQSNLLLALIFFGGVLFLTISEGKTQYSLQYFLLLLPFAGQGTAAVADSLGHIAEKWRHKPPKHSENGGKI